MYKSQIWWKLWLPVIVRSLNFHLKREILKCCIVSVNLQSRGKINRRRAIFIHRSLRQSAWIDGKRKHQGAVFLSYCCRLGISNAKFHNFKPMHLSLKYNKWYLIPPLKYCAIFDLIKVASGSQKMAPGSFKISAKLWTGSHFWEKVAPGPYQLFVPLLASGFNKM